MTQDSGGVSSTSFSHPFYLRIVMAPTLKGTDLIHYDDDLSGPEVAPSIAVSTSTFFWNGNSFYLTLPPGSFQASRTGI